MLQEKQSIQKKPDNKPAAHPDRVKVGIIGLGRMGGYHFSVCTHIPTIELVAIADPSENNLRKVTDNSITTSSSYKNWLDLVDAVIIAVPTDLHYEITKDCLLANKHVLLEKPLTKNIAQAQELFKIAQERNYTLHVGHVERFNGAVQELKKIIHKPYLIESHRMGPFSSRVQNDSVVLDLMIHDLDIILGLVGVPVDSVKVTGEKILSPHCDIAMVQLKFVNGVMANLVSSRASQVKQRTMAIHQQDAFIKLDFTTQDISIHRHTSSSVTTGHNQMKYKQESMVERLFVYKDNPLKQEVEHFITAVQTNNNRFDPQQDIEALKLTLMIEEQLKDIHSYPSINSGRAGTNQTTHSAMPDEERKQRIHSS